MAADSKQEIQIIVSASAYDICRDLAVLAPGTDLKFLFLHINPQRL